MRFPTYLQFSLSSSELFLTFRLYKQASLVPIRYRLVLHLFNDSCRQKRSQLHPWHCIPAVPPALHLAEVVGQIWQETISVKISPQNPILCLSPLTSPVIDFSTGKGTGPWSRDKLWEGMQTAGSDRSLQWHQENTTWSSCGGTRVGKVWCECGFRWMSSHLWLREHSPCPLTRKISQKIFSFAVSLKAVLIKKKKICWYEFLLLLMLGTELLCTMTPEVL